MNSVRSIPRTTTSTQAPSFRTPQAIYDGECPICGGPLSVDTAHVGGHAFPQPFAVCVNPDRGDHYLIARIEPEVYFGYLELVDGMKQANEEYCQRLNDELLGDVA